MRTKSQNFALKISGLYITLSLLWIIFSDMLAKAIAHDMQELRVLSTYKGWGFVLFTGSLLYILIRKEISVRNEIENELKTALNKIEESERLLKEQNEEYESLNEELRQTNDDLIKSKDKAEESDRLKSAFLANISHEIRTPMNGIIGFSDLLTSPNLQEQKRQFFTDIIKESSQRLLNIFNNLIEISKLQTHQAKPVFTPIKLSSVLKNIYETYHNRATRCNIEFSYKLSFDENLKINTDGFMLQEVLRHLIDNALKFTKEGYVKLAGNIVGSTLEFSVSDTGIGIPEHIGNKIFESFRQVETSMARVYGGTGLGLSLARGYVKVLDGEIWFQPNASGGTTFFVQIPLVEVQEEEPLVDKVNRQGKHLLVVEDEEINYLYIKEVLDSTKIPLLFARNGLEAVELVSQSEQVQMVLMDIKMPVMDGISATKKIKEIKPNIVVIGQTAYTSPSDLDTIRKSGFTDVITKPMSQAALLEIVKKHWV
jgi:signal transduction histidine kinase